MPDSGRDHCVSGQVFTFDHEDAAGELLPEEGRQGSKRAVARPVQNWLVAVTWRSARDRRSENGGFERQRSGAGAQMIAGSARSMGLEVVG